MKGGIFMGAWGNDIMDNDSAGDINEALDNYLEEGLSLKKAFNKIKKSLCKEVEYEWKILALAYLQIKKMGTIDESLLKESRNAIEEELEYVNDWKEPSERRKCLLKFKKLINLPKDKLASYFIMEKLTN